MDIVRKAVAEPLRQIANNAGLEGSVVVNEVEGQVVEVLLPSGSPVRSSAMPPAVSAVVSLRTQRLRAM